MDFFKFKPINIIAQNNDLNMNVFQCQLINIITQNNDIYRLLYSVLYLCIIIIIGIFLYWDIIYKTAKKYSKCNNISKIIDDNYYNETPYIYSIIIINTKMIKKPHEYIIKITYDFNKMVTKIDFGNTEGEGNIFVDRMHDYITIYKNITELEKKKKDLYDDFKKNNKKTDLAQYNKVAIEHATLISSSYGKKAIELHNKPGYIETFKYNYYDLDKMNPEILENISTLINSNDYKYYAVDKNYNIIYSYTTTELIKFSKAYSKNTSYPITIIDYIIFSKLQQKNNINI